MIEKMLAYLQYILPQHAITKVAGMLANSTIPWLKNWQIKKFIHKTNLDLKRVLEPNINAYANFQAFFIRRIKPQYMGNSNAGEIASPVEATITQHGIIHDQILIQAKGQSYSLADLFNGDESLTNRFRNGSYLSYFLAPHNYHRYHMPIRGTLRKTIFVPGRIYGVDFSCQRIVPNLYARNERYVTVFDTEIGKMAIILIGAFLVGSIKPVWMSKPVDKNNQRRSYDIPRITLNQMEELGVFLAGSSVIVLFEPNKINFFPKLHLKEVNVGEPVAKYALEIKSMNEIPKSSQHYFLR